MNENVIERIDPLFFTTVLIKGVNGNKKEPLGTGFFLLSEDNTPYLVTNKHLIYGNNFAMESAKPDVRKIEVKIHVDRTNLQKSIDVIIDLFDEEGKEKWLEHKDRGVDIILIKIKEEGVFGHIKAIKMDFLDFSNILIEMAEKIIILGYPLGNYDKLNNLPICRIGHLISPFGVGFNGKNYLLGDIEAHRGMSGAPVFVQIKDYKTKEGTIMLGQTTRRLIGVLSANPEWKDEGGKIVKPKIVEIYQSHLILEIIKNTVKNSPNSPSAEFSEKDAVNAKRTKLRGVVTI